MRRFLAIAKATALETASEPAAFLLTIGAVAFLAFASVFHIHQFGEAARMPRDVSLSAILVFGALYSASGAVKALRGEIESGTAQMALARPVPRPLFFLGKCAGVLAASLAFSATVFCAASVTVIGAKLGGTFAASRGDIAFVWGPAVAADAAIVAVPLVVAAALNRFFSFRFTVSASVCALAAGVLSVAGICAFALSHPEAAFAADTPLRLLPAAVLAALPQAFFVPAAAAFSVRLRENAAAALTALAAAAFLPAFGNYYVSDALARGGAVPWSYVMAGAAAIAPLSVAFVLLGAKLITSKDIG